MISNKHYYTQTKKIFKNGSLTETDEILNDRQASAARHLKGPVLIAAGAGSGKTKTLINRLIKLIASGINPAGIVAVTFTNKAAEEMRKRISNFQFPVSSFPMPFIGTLHSFGAKILKNETGFIGRRPNFSIFDEDDSLRLIKNAMKKIDLDKEQFSPPAIQNKISRAKNELITSALMEKQAENIFEKTAAKIFKKYETLLKENNGFDFDDLIAEPVFLFKKYPEILEKYQNRWTHFLVDEYQDINTAQYWMLKILAEKEGNICAVGDDNQSIYAFRGADFRNFLNFEKDWPATKIILLEENYRSSSNIIRAASAVISQNRFQKPKTLWTKNPDGEPVSIIKTAGEEEESDFIAETIKQQAFGSQPPASIAILYRTNAQSRSLEQSLLANKVPYEIFGGIRFYARKEIKDLTAGLRFGSNPQDLVSLERINKTFGKKTAAVLANALPNLARQKKILDVINFLIETGNYFRYLKNNFKNYEERLENVKELIKFAGNFQNFNPPLGLQLFLEQTALLQSADKTVKNKSAIKLMTIHLAKGLEFDAVFIAGCEEGTLPHHRSYDSRDSLEEERRLFYVAMTRAKKKLFLTFSQTPSRFLYEIPPELLKFQNLSQPSQNIFNEEENWIDPA